MDFGLCDTCKHQRIVKSGRGSTFSMCELGRTDANWPKYPRVPVAKCGRYEPGSSLRYRPATHATPPE
jgi:hypothetical protein